MLKNKRERKSEEGTSSVPKKTERCEEYLLGTCLKKSACDKIHRRSQYSLLIMESGASAHDLLNINYIFRKREIKIDNKDGDKAEIEEESKKEDISDTDLSKTKEKNKARKATTHKKHKNEEEEDSKEPLSKSEKLLKNKAKKVKKENKKDKKEEKKSKKPKEPKKKESKPKKGKISKEPKSSKKGFVMMTSKTKIFDEDCPEFLEGKCEKLFCDKIHNFSLKFKEENNQEFARRYHTLYQDFSVLNPYYKKLYGDTSLDIMFIVDCTGSMSGWISQVKTELSNIIDFIQNNNPHSAIRVSFVGYRDHDVKEKTRKFSIHDFTEDINAMKSFIQSVTAHGGADGPEDVTGGLKKALEQNWSSTAKYAVLICDAPCHGTQYHDQGSGDYFQSGCPNKLVPEELIKEFSAKEITFYGVKIDNSTDKMYKILSEAYEAEMKKPIIVGNLGHCTDKLGFFVSQGASQTLSAVTVNHIPLKEILLCLEKEASVSQDEMNEEYKTKLNGFLGRINSMNNESISEKKNASENNCDKMEVEAAENIKEEKILELKITENTSPDFNNLNKDMLSPIEANCFSFFIKKDRHTNINWKNPYIQNSCIKSKVKISSEPFSSGAMRYAFYMKDEELGQNLVGKIPKIMSKERYTIESLAKELEAITISSNIAQDFNERIVNTVSDTKLLLNFIHNYIYQILDDRHEYKYYSVENYIKGDYVKYNNNAGWMSDKNTEQSMIAQAFSHFSWQLTKGYLMIVDLQGVGGYLTDPAIHCLNPKKYGDGNLGYIGMMKFFFSHNCNKYCKQLELIHPKNWTNIDKDYKFFVDKYVPPSPTSMIYKLCDLCRTPTKVNALDLYNLRKKCWECFCLDCEAKRKNSFKGAKCSVCSNFFKSASYIYKMKRLPFPDKCMKCRQTDVNKNRDEFYKDGEEAKDENVDII
jgi:hypothetical protein